MTSSGAKGSSLQRPRVDALEHRDAWVGAHLRVQLPVAHVERDHPPRTRLQEAIGEAASRGADVEAVLPGRVDAEPLERVRELLAAARDEARRALDLELRRLRPPACPACRSRGRGRQARVPAPGCDSPRARARRAGRRAASSRGEVTVVPVGRSFDRLHDLTIRRRCLGHSARADEARGEWPASRTTSTRRPLCGACTIRPRPR